MYVTRFKGNKVAAASYTFDDGYASSGRIAEIFEYFDARVTFYIVPGSIETTTEWDFWKAISDKGHEIGNHSMTHTINMSDPTLSDQTLDDEINGAKAAITQNLGVVPLTFAFPWHQYTAKAMDVASQSHFSVRQLDIGSDKYTFAFFDQEHTATLDEALATVNKQLADMVEVGGWFVAGGHGVEGDGWSPVPAQFLIDHLIYARQFARRLWIDTYANVARYRACRAKLTPRVISQASNSALIELGGEYDAAWCTKPLTVAVPLKKSPEEICHVRTVSGSTIPNKISGGRLIFELLPGEQALIEISQERMPPASYAKERSRRHQSGTFKRISQF